MEVDVKPIVITKRLTRRGRTTLKYMYVVRLERRQRYVGWAHFIPLTPLFPEE